MIVGFTRDNYSVKRNILVDIEGVSYNRLYDISFAVAAVAKGFKQLGLNCDYLKYNNTFSSKYFGRADVLHLWNGISFADLPWVTTFETALPRSSHFYKRLFGGACGNVTTKLKLSRFEEEALQALESDRCIAIFCLSKSTFNIQSEIFKALSLRKAHDKLQIMHPPQKILKNQQNDCDSDLKFMFVGASFFRKGGREIVSAMMKLKKSGYPVKLTVVSCLGVDAYATGESHRDVALWEETLKANSDWITWLTKVPNNCVLELMKQHNIGLLPTHADTYGYSVLEFQASGCPVISTDIRALPEINNDEIGWLIKVPKNGHGEALYGTPEQRFLLSETIEAGILGTIQQIFQDLSSISRKRMAAIQHLKNNNDPAAFATKLRHTYNVIN